MRALIIILFLCSMQFAYGQDVALPAKSQSVRDRLPCPKAYIGLNTGLNNPNGIVGINFEVPVKNGFALSAGAGADLWGTMVYAEGRYYLGVCHRGWALGAGINHSTGRRNFKPKQTVETINGNEHVALDLLPQTNVYLSVYHAWNLGKKRNKIFAEIGWSVPLKKKDFKQIAGDPMTQDALEKVNKWSPGGLIVGGGVYFGIH